MTRHEHVRKLVSQRLNLTSVGEISWHPFIVSIPISPREEDLLRAGYQVCDFSQRWEAKMINEALYLIRSATGFYSYRFVFCRKANKITEAHVNLEQIRDGDHGEPEIGLWILNHYLERVPDRLPSSFDQWAKSGKGGFGFSSSVSMPRRVEAIAAQVLGHGFPREV